MPFTSPVTVQLNNNQVVLTIPANSLLVNNSPVQPGSPVSISVIPEPLTAMSGGKPLLSYQLNGEANGVAIDHIAASALLSLTMKYDPTLIAADSFQPQDLQLFLISDSGSVSALPSSVDQVNDTVTASLPIFGQVILAGVVSRNYVPLVANDIAGPGW